MTEFDIVSEEAIRDGRATDRYFELTEDALAAANRNPEVVAEVGVSSTPTGEFRCLAGVKDVAHLLAGYPVDVDAVLEGQLFDHGPVLRISGQYAEFARLETSILGFLSQATGYATRALEARRAAPDTQLLSFGARHVHPSTTAMLERSALIADFDGISHVAAGEVIGREASGTMPHALVLAFGPGQQEAAWAAYDDGASDDVPRIALCDTFTDEVDESIRAAELLGDALDGVRIDTTASRQGNYEAIAREVRWELDARGFDDVELFCSGGIDPELLRSLRPHADGFGVGGFVTDAEPVDFAMDIVEVDGEPIAKRGTLSARKEPYRTEDGDHVVVRADQRPPDEGWSLFDPLIRDGEIVASFSIDRASDRARSDARVVEFREE
jgi:nicotinate phosphoribosyltransferase